MFVSESLDVNTKNHLQIGGVDAVELAEQYGTPLYVMDEDLIRKNCRIYKDAVDKYYDGNGLILYASKAFSCMHIYRVVMQEGLGIDVVSGGELYTAIKAKFPMDKVYFHGNNKTNDEIELAIKNGVGRIVVDNVFELGRVDAISAKHNKVTKILFRIKPGIDAHTHDFIQTGQIDSKFGVALETGEAMDIVMQASKLKNVEVVGAHCHIGSQIFELEPFKLAAKLMTRFMADVKDKLGITMSELNLGGGFGIKYVNSDAPVPYDEYIKSVSEVVKNTAKERGIDMPKIIMEPGRSLVGSAGITLYTVGSVKNIPNVRTYVSVDGGMCDNPRYILYGAEYSALIANRANDKPDMAVTIAGKCCESGDLLAKDAMLADVKTGDILAVLATGAYNYSMSSNYNRIPRPPVVMVSDGKSKIVVKRETYDDIIRNDV
ncbi:MAG: diaminopimelate decarboxylase [Ruminococcaceae bacterium]|nr:diaminopimelate decarboxylase [Oscillospiraceae bacterium]